MMQHFVLPTPTLQHVAEMKIVTDLWSQRDIFTQIAASFNGQPSIDLDEDEQEWKAMEDKVTSQISAFSLPESCKRNLSTVIKPIGIEVINWCLYHNLDNHSFQFLDTLLPEHLCWSMRGTIDYAKTAELLVGDERVEVEKRYEIACLNCLEEEARQLFPLVTVQQRQKYIIHGALYQMMDPRILIAFFTCTFSNNLERLNSLIWDLRGRSLHQYLFAIVLANGSRATGEYFLRKVNEREKELVFGDNAAPFFSKRSPTCGIIYHLSLLNAEQPDAIFGAAIDSLLKRILRWPMLPLFVNAAENGWHFLDDSDCADVLSDVIDKVRYGFQDYDYCQLFWECWRLTPAGHKRYFLSVIDQLQCLFDTKQKEIIQLVLNEAPSHRLKKLIDKRYDAISEVLMDENATLMEWKETAALNSSNDQERLRSQQVSRLVDMVMENRI